MEVSERILHLLEQQHITPYRVSQDTHISESTFSNWKAKPTSKISSETVIAISNYLGISCDYLLRGEQTPADEAARKAAGSLLPYRELVDAYRRADAKSKSIVRSALDLPPEK